MRPKFGLFETMRYYHGNIVCLNEHIKRLKESAKLIGLKIPYSEQGLKLLIHKAIKKNGYKDQRVKLLACRAGVSVIIKKYLAYTERRYYKGFSAIVSDFRQDESSMSCRVKLLDRFFYELAYTKATQLGFDEAIVLNTKGKLTECTRSNIFLVKQNKIFTPSLDCGCLGGITRGLVFSLCKKLGLKYSETGLTVKDLYRADEAFLTNSLMGIMPLALVDKRKIGSGSRGEITGLLMSEYKKLLTGLG